MIALKNFKCSYQSSFLSNHSFPQRCIKSKRQFAPRQVASTAQIRKLGVRASASHEGEKKTEKRSFLTLEEAGLVEISSLGTHERFLCRLTVSITISLIQRKVQACNGIRLVEKHCSMLSHKCCFSS